MKTVNIETVYPSTYEADKDKHGDTIILYTDKKYYCAYDEDAEKLDKAISYLSVNTYYTDIRTQYKACSFPANMIDACLPKIIRAGNRVAITDHPDLTDKKPQETNNQTINNINNIMEKFKFISQNSFFVFDTTAQRLQAVHVVQRVFNIKDMTVDTYISDGIRERLLMSDEPVYADEGMFRNSNPILPTERTKCYIWDNLIGYRPQVEPDGKYYLWVYNNRRAEKYYLADNTGGVSQVIKDGLSTWSPNEIEQLPKFYNTEEEVYQWNDYYTRGEGDAEEEVVEGKFKFALLTPEQQTLVDEYNALVRRMKDAKIQVYHDREDNIRCFINGERIEDSSTTYDTEEDTVDSISEQNIIYRKFYPTREIWNNLVEFATYTNYDNDLLLGVKVK